MTLTFIQTLILACIAIQLGCNEMWGIIMMVLAFVALICEKQKGRFYDRRRDP